MALLPLFLRIFTPVKMGKERWPPVPVPENQLSFALTDVTGSTLSIRDE